MDERSCIVKPAFTVVGHNCKQITPIFSIKWGEQQSFYVMFVACSVIEPGHVSMCESRYTFKILLSHVKRT